MSQQARLDIAWVGEELAQYKWARESAAKTNKPLPEFVKDALERARKNSD